MPDYLKVIVVDFDNTICFFNEDFSCEKLVPGAKEGIKRLREAGYRITISSARNNIAYGGCGGEPHRTMHRFLVDQGVEHDRIDLGTDGKLVAYRHIDDKGVGCPLTPEGVVDWSVVCNILLGDVS